MTYTPRRPALSATIAEAVAFATKSASPDVYETLARQMPRGDGPVLVLPPVFKTDSITDTMRGFLARLGYAPHGWNLGINIGPTTAAMRGAAERLVGIAAESGPVALVGISMGGLFARWLALEYPQHVRQVITCASPFRNAPRSAFIPLEDVLNALPGPDLRTLSELIAAPLPVPVTCIYTRRDGIVAWESCLDPARPADNAEVACNHVLMPVDPEVFRILAHRLADPAYPLETC